MKCPHCGQEHPDNQIECPSTGNGLKKACINEKCSYYGEYLWPLEKEDCPCCGHPLYNTHRGHWFVDLGLSVKWATCNVGAMKPEDCGDYFAWSETTSKSAYTWYNLKGLFIDEIQSELRKQVECFINAGVQMTDNANWLLWFSKYKYQCWLDPEDDAARMNWRGEWRIPMAHEYYELIDKCNWERSIINGVEGCRVTSKLNGHSIFLPTFGYRDGSSLLEVGSLGCYWSSSLYTNNHLYANFLRFTSGNDYSLDHRYLRCGLSVRPVCP